MLNKTIVILSPGFPSNENETSCLPTVQQFILSLKNNFPSLKIVVLAFQYPFTKKNYLWHGIEVIALGGKNKKGINRFFNLVRAYLILNKLHKKYKDFWLLSFWLTECSLLARFFCEKNKLNYFMWLQGQDAKKDNQYIKRIRPKSEKLFAISSFTQNEFLKNHNVKAGYIIENGINETIFPAINNMERAIDVFGAGSLTDVKNYTLFIEIIFELKKNRPKINTIIAGEGEQKLALLELIKKHDLINNVKLVGSKTHKEVLELMNDSKLFLHTSKFEGNPAVMHEALYSGCYAFSNQKLSDRLIDKHFIYNSKNEFVLNMNSLLDKKLNHERVLVNSMQESAKKVVSLFLEKKVF